MKGTYPWLYVDYKERLWKFSINEKEELYYEIMYDEGKWTKEKLIDSRVSDFGLFIDDNEGIHLVYSNKRGELRYCTLKEKQWLGKVLYKIEDNNYDIESIKIDILGSVMNIFFALNSKDGSDHGILMHCIWDGNKININKLQDIILRNELKEYYLININNKSKIYLFYLSDEGDELSLNYSIYSNNKWNSSKRLYGIQGDEVYFEVQLENDKLHIINRSKENNTYYLDHVMIDEFNNMESYSIYSGNKILKDPLIFKEEDKIYSCWIEEDIIYYSIFNLIKWEAPKKFDIENVKLIERYNAYISNIKNYSINKFKLYGTIGLDLYLYYPKDLIFNKRDDSNLYIEDIESDLDNVDLEDDEVYKLRREKKVLEEKINQLNIILDKDRKVIEKYKEKLDRALEQKIKAEENSSIFLELQKKSQREYDNLVKEVNLLKKEKSNIEIELKDEKSELRIEEKVKEEYKEINEKLNTVIKEKETLEVKSKKYIDEIGILNTKLEDILEILTIKDKELEEKKDINNNLEDYNKMLIEENLTIKKELSSVIDENKRLNDELEIERNQSVMERLLRRRG